MNYFKKRALLICASCVGLLTTSVQCDPVVSKQGYAVDKDSEMTFDNVINLIKEVEEDTVVSTRDNNASASWIIQQNQFHGSYE